MVAGARTLSVVTTFPGHRQIQDDVKRDLWLTVLFTILHLPIGLILYRSGALGIIHPLVVIGCGVYLAFNKYSKYSSIALVLAYLIGVEVLWRMANVPVYWEIGKYGSIAIILVAVARRSRWEIPKLPLLYFGVLIPGCILSAVSFGPSQLYNSLSFNMSGPLLLLCSSWFFYKARLEPPDFRRLLLAITIPLLCVAFTSLFYTVSAEEINFTGESNFQTSGGFGPNQVSSLLGLGVFVSFAGAVIVRKGIGFSLFFGAATLSLAAICMLTFSRSGIYNATAGIAILLIFGLRDTTALFKRLAFAVGVCVLFVAVIFPMVNEFTGGALQSRFEDTQTSGRSEILLADIEVFSDHPILGVGVGSARAFRTEFLGHGAVSHTEFSRLLSEHGLFGVGALLTLAGMVVINLRRPNSMQGKAFIAGAFAYSIFFMLNSGMRLGAPSFLWGLGFAVIVNARGVLPPRKRLTTLPRRSNSSLRARSNPEGITCQSSKIPTKQI